MLASPGSPVLITPHLARSSAPAGDYVDVASSRVDLADEFPADFHALLWVDVRPNPTPDPFSQHRQMAAR